MDSSLEELLAKEGYRGRRSGLTSRASFRAESTHSDSSQRPRDHLLSTQRPITQKHRLSIGSQTGEHDTRHEGPNSDPSHRNKSSSFSKKKSWGFRDPSHVSSSKSLKYLEGDEGQWRKSKNRTPELALDEVAVKAMVSILNDYISRFINDKEFRVTLRQNCFSCLNINEENTTNAITNLEQAIAILEKAASEDVSSRKDLKTAAMCLSMITSLDSNNSGSELPACAHLYLSVAYKLRKNDKASAKYLLQVFCDCPFLARAHLLPDLWGYLLFPHLSHLEEWYDQQVLSLLNSAERTRKLELLDKVYSEILDSGTFQVARYYKDWLTEGIQAPSLPPVHIPTVSFCDHSSEFSSPRPVVSKKLYESVFRNSTTREIEEIIDNNGEDTLEVTFPSDFDDLSASQEECKSTEVNSQPEMDINNGFSKFDEHHFDLFNSFSGDKTYDLILMKLAESVFESHQDSSDLTVPVISQTSKLKHIEATDSFHLGAPEDFICPLSGKLIEDPVTLETGQTFERAAIDNWFKHGNQTCPVTGKLLTCQALPFTNIVLKRLIDGWKSERCSHLIALAAKMLKTESDQTAVSVFELLLTCFGEEQRLANAKRLVSLGGLEFLLGRFALGNAEEKTQIAALLLCFIEADVSCRNQICKNIERRSLFELLQSKEQKSQRYAVLLLIQLICPSKKDAKLFLRGVKNEEIANAKHVLLMYLEMSPLEEKPWVSALILHLDLLVEPQKDSIYREKAVDAIALVLNLSLTHDNIRESCFRVLVTLLGRSSPLKEATSISKSEIQPREDEEETMKEWLRNLWRSLVSDKKRSFLEAMSKWLESGNSTLVEASLITIAWLSCETCSLNDAKMHGSAFSVLVSGLEDIVRSSDQIEHKVLASMSLLNFTNISG